MPARLFIPESGIRHVLKKCGGNISAAAHMLDVSPQTLARRLKAKPSLATPDVGKTELRETKRMVGLLNRANDGHFPTIKKILTTADPTLWGQVPEPARLMEPEEVAEFLYELSAKPRRSVTVEFKPNRRHAR